MKRIVSIWIAVVMGGMMSPVMAQVPEGSDIPSSVQAEADYRYQFDQYRNSYNDYLVTKTEYHETGSLQAEQEALGAAKKVAVNRAEVLRTYNRWVMLQLLEFRTPYPQAETTAAKLNTQFGWYLDHKAKIQATASVSAFESVMDEYTAETKNREKLYAQAQIDLKLAWIAFFQQQARALYDPILSELMKKTDIPEVEQGLAKVAALGDQINELILNTRTKVGAIESEDIEVAQGLRQVGKLLEELQSKQLVLINTMMELETRYVR